MLVKWLEATTYNDDHEYFTSRVDNPSWDKIEAAIKNLDRFYRPFIQLGLYDDFQKCLDDGMIEVMGGGGVYWIAITAQGYWQRRLHDPAKGTHYVEVWTSDQGFEDEEQYVCYDLDTVLRVIKLFAETATFDPLVTWEAG
jgi:hypothetical protein